MKRTSLKAIVTLWVGALLATPLPYALGQTNDAANPPTAYFVARHGDDDHDGLSRADAFATIQRGVDALEPGDTLTILPGEYLGSVMREGLGADGVRTTIRAEMPGTVTMRGDVPLPEFQPLDGHRFVYVADVDFDEEVQVVNELDTLTVIESLPALGPLEFNPGAFYHDVEAGKLYLSTPDLASPQGRPYTASVTPAQGLHLVEPRGVTVEGLAVTGFNRNEMAPRHDRSQYSTWGILVTNGRDCIIRECHVYLNGQGIQVGSFEEGNGNNVIERCRAWGNDTQYGSGDRGGLTIHHGRNDTIRDSVAFRNGNYGINIRSEAGGPPPRDEDGNYIFNYENKSRIIASLAWGNDVADFKIKTGHSYVHTVERSIGPDLWSVTPKNVSHSIVSRNREHPQDNINLWDNDELEPQREFADPLNHDYRLQSTSRFRNAAPDGSDRGPLPYEPTVFYVSPEGDDAADGLSIQNAWRTVERALPGLDAGDTLYLASGIYDVDLDWDTGSATDAPIHVRGRGDGEVVLRGALRAHGQSRLDFKRLAFDGTVSLDDSAKAAMTDCTFTNGSLTARGLEALRITHCLFTDAPLVIAESEGVHLASNLYAHDNAPAVRLDAATQLKYSDYNLYADEAHCMTVGDEIRAFRDLDERHSQVADVTMDASANGVPRAAELGWFTAAGLHGTSPGPHSFRTHTSDVVRLVGPWVQSVTDTTANIEWATSGPTHNPNSDNSRNSSVQLAWGKTPEMEHRANRQANRFGDFSLTGLAPDTEYFVRLSLYRPLHHEPTGDPDAFTNTTEDSVTLRFRTTADASGPHTYYVTPDGADTHTGLTRDEAWGTIQHAASQVGPGDTVLIGGGVYHEAVKIRATGEENRPITFKAMPGEKVVMDGLERTLEYAFFAVDKSHLRFDGFYFIGFKHGSNNMPWSDVGGGNNGVFVLYESHDVRITRCFLDGRGWGSSSGLAHARHCKDFVVENSVMLNCMGRLQIYWNSPRTRIRHNVFLRNFITHVAPHIRGNRIQNDEDQCRFEHNIVTDNLQKKIHVGLGVNAENRHNAFYLRVPPEQRTWSRRGESTFADMLADLGPDDQTLVANPQFRATLAMDKVNDEGEPIFLADRLIHKRDLDFPDLFATHPDLVEHGIGLEPEAFEDFHFNTTDQTADRQ